MKQQLKKLLTIPYLNLLMVMILFGFTFYSLFAPIVPAVYGKPIVKDANNIQAGKLLTYKIHACRKVGEGVVTTITRKLVSVSNKQLQPITLSADTVANPARCADAEKTLIVPYSTPEGDYQLVITGIYSIIPLREPITVTAQSDSFHVKKADPAQIIVEGQSVESLTYQGASVITPSVNNTTNNSTVNNTTNNSVVPGKGSDEPQPGVIPGLIRALGGGGLNITF